jgi:hypothetical protein
MRGTIRSLLGLFVVFGAAGGLDNATDAQLVMLLPIVAVGLALMYSGVRAMKGN